MPDGSSGPVVLQAEARGGTYIERRLSALVHSLCELAGVLGTWAAMPCQNIAAVIRGLIDAQNVVVDSPAVEAGLAVLDAGSDFANGVTAFGGQWLGGETLVSFDRRP